MSNTVELVPELESSQEEADTRMMLHLAHISQYDFSCGVIAIIDADVTQIYAFVPEVLFRN